MKIHLLGISAILIGALAVPVQATPVQGSNGNGGSGGSNGVTTSTSTSCGVANVYATLTDNSTRPFEACFGPADGNLTGNPDNIDAIAGWILANWSYDVDYLGASNTVDAGPFAAGSKATTGTLVLDQILYGDFVFGLHGPKPGGGDAAGQYTLYAFSLPAPLGAVSLHFDLAGTSLNSSGSVQGLSHAVLYGTLPAPGERVPEPGTLALAALAALGAAGVAVRRRRPRG